MDSKDMTQLEFRLNMISIHNVLCYTSVYINDIEHLTFSKISSNFLQLSANNLKMTPKPLPKHKFGDMVLNTSSIYETEIQMPFDWPRPEEPSVWERNRSFDPIRPFSDPKLNFFCLKRSCNAVFRREELLGNHEKFAHSKHPLSGDIDSVRSLREEDEDEVIKMKEKKEDPVYKVMARMSMDFFERNVAKEGEKSLG